MGTLTDNYSYSGFGELSQHQALNGTTSLFNDQYTRDALGRITQKVETTNSTVTTYDYSYDAAGHLAQVKQSQGSFVISTNNYTYDSNGNRLTAPNLSTSPIYDDQDRLLTYGTASYTYTANGELASKTDGTSVTQYQYDVLGNLKHVTLPNGTIIDYLVDGKDRRVGKKINGVQAQGFLYQEQLKPIAELDGNNNVVSRFVYATHVNVPDYMIKGGVTYRIITDHLGSPRLVVNTTDGSITQRMDFDEFGNVISDSNPGFQPFGFAGGLYDLNTGLVRFGARDYDAYTGRWTAKDPIGFKGGDNNVYGYALSNPVVNIDNNGLESVKEIAANSTNLVGTAIADPALLASSLAYLQSSEFTGKLTDQCMALKDYCKDDPNQASIVQDCFNMAENIDLQGAQNLQSIAGAIEAYRNSPPVKQTESLKNIIDQYQIRKKILTEPVSLF